MIPLIWICGSVVIVGLIVVLANAKTADDAFDADFAAIAPAGVVIAVLWPLLLLAALAAAPIFAVYHAATAIWGRRPEPPPPGAAESSRVVAD